MLKQLHRLLHAHLTALGFSAWMKDCVPEGAALPCVTMQVEPSPAFGGHGRVLLSCWSDGSASHTQRLDMADDIRRTVPVSGLPLWLESGLMVLYPAGEASVTAATQAGLQGLTLPFDLVNYTADPTEGEVT